MVSNPDPHNIYLQEKSSLEAELQVLQKKRNRLGWLRLGIVLITTVAVFQLFSISLLWGITALVGGIAFFLFLVSVDVNNQQKIDHTKRLLRINETELAVLDHRFVDLNDGLQFQPDDHPYAADLDLFGKASLYQYINRCKTEQGQQLLAGDLLQPVLPEQILLRQQAVRELAPDFKWRQHLQALFMENNISIPAQKGIERWADEPEVHFTRSFWNYFVPMYSLLTLASIVLAIAGWINFSVFSFLFVLYFTFAALLSRKAMKAYTDLNGIIKETDTLYQVIECVEKRIFQSKWLQQLQQDAATPDSKAYVQLKQLKNILNRFDLRLNIMVFIFVNSFLLWDVRQMMALNDWRKKNKSRLHSWFHLIASFELANSLATLHFNQPAWAFLVMTPLHFSLKGTLIGHPLLPPEVRVTSDFHLSGTGRVALVTGSNMAGKSTFLRSLGTNIVLAQIGAPVCATHFEISPVQLMSSMRIADNLAENTSTFYAELKKLKAILEAVNRKEHVFILLDEILRGTNSLDRHTGSMAVVKQLIRKKAVAVIATHDVAIGKLEDTFGESIRNYHFDVQVAGEELYFDYKLKDGICTSLNASLLMKKIGIEM